MLADMVPKESTLAAPLTALFNTSLRDGVIPALWKTAHVIPLPKKQPPRSIEKDIRPISLTPIVSKIFLINCDEMG